MSATVADISDDDGRGRLTHLVNKVKGIGKGTSLISRLRGHSTDKNGSSGALPGLDSSSRRRSEVGYVAKHLATIDHYTVSTVAVGVGDKVYSAASMQGTVKTFSVETGEEVDSFSVRPAAVNALVFLRTPNSAIADQVLCVGTHNGAVHFRHVGHAHTEHIHHFGGSLARPSNTERNSGSSPEPERASKPAPPMPAFTPLPKRAPGKDGGGPARVFVSPHSEVHALAASRLPADGAIPGAPPKSVLLAIGGRLTQGADHIEVLAVKRPQPRVLDLADEKKGEAAPLSLKLVARLSTISSITRALAFDAAGLILVASGDARVVQLWSMRRAHGTSARSLAEVEFRCATQVHAVALSASGGLLAVGCVSCTEVYDVMNDEVAIHLSSLSSGRSDEENGDGDDDDERAPHSPVYKRWQNKGGQPRARRLSHPVKVTPAPIGTDDTSTLSTEGKAPDRPPEMRRARSANAGRQASTHPPEVATPTSPRDAATVASPNHAMGFGLGRSNSQRFSLDGRSSVGGAEEEAAKVVLSPHFAILPCLYLSDCKCDTGGVAIAQVAHAAEGQSGSRSGMRLGEDATHAGGTLLAVASGSRVRVLDVDSGSTLGIMAYDDSDARARCVALSSDGSFVLSGHFDAKIRLHFLMAGCSMVSFGHVSSSRVVRCVHVSSDSKSLAAGGEYRGKGLLQIFAVKQERLLHEWTHPATVEHLQFSPDGSLLGVAARCMPFTLYSTVPPFEVVCQLPAFAKAVGGMGENPNLWRFAFSATSEVVAVTAHNGEQSEVGTYRIVRTAPPATRASIAASTAEPPPPLEALGSPSKALEALGSPSQPLEASSLQAPAAPTAAPAAAPAAAPPVSPPAALAERAVALHLVAKIAFAVPAYCVALDASGAHCVVGGRDRYVAMYHCPQPLHGRAPSRESVARQEWISMHPDATRIYAVTVSSDLQYCCFGGLAKSVCVANGMTGELFYTLPADGRTLSLSLLEGSGSNPRPMLAFSGEFDSVQVVDVAEQHVVMRLPTEEAESTLSVALSPSSCAFSDGSRVLAYGQGGQHSSRDDPPAFGFIARLVRDAAAEQGLESNASMEALEMMLAAHPSAVNARDPRLGTTLLQYAMGFADPHLLDLLLRRSECRIGLHPDRHGITPLHVALEPGRQQLLQLLLSNMINGRFTLATAGAMQTLSSCWAKMSESYPHEFLAYVSQVELEPEPEVLGDALTNVVLPNGKKKVVGSDVRCPRGIWDDKLDEYRVGSAVVGAPEDCIRDDYWDDGAATKLTGREGRIRNVPIGFRLSASAFSGIRAVRLPIENIAGVLFDGPGGRRTSFLQLVIEAVNRTHDMKVFASPVLEYLLKWKLRFTTSWGRLLSKLIEILIISLYTCQLVRRPHELEVRIIVLFVAFGIAALKVAKDLRQELSELRATGREYWRSPVKWMEMLKPWFMLIPLLPYLFWLGGSADEAVGRVNAVYFVGENAPSSALSTSHWSAVFSVDEKAAYEVSLFRASHGPTGDAVLFAALAARDSLTCYVLAYTLSFEVQELLELHETSAASYFASFYNFQDQVAIISLAVIVVCHLQERAGNAAYGDFEPVFFTMQMFWYAVAFTRLLDHFRGLRTFAVYVHLIYSVFQDFSKFVIIASILWLGLALAVDTQLELARRQHFNGTTSMSELNGLAPTDEALLSLDDLDRYPAPAPVNEWMSRWLVGDQSLLGTGTLLMVWNMGFYGHIDRATTILLEEHLVLAVVFFLYMLITHIFLLNVMIAVMSRTMSLESKEARLVAKYRQCMLVLQQEVEEEAYGGSRSVDPHPRWLHVLLPIEQHESALGEALSLGGGGDEDEMGRVSNQVRLLLRPSKSFGLLSPLEAF